ncbi:MAG: M14 family zinc carboxypeptidase, partial [bacterium]
MQHPSASHARRLLLAAAAAAYCLVSAASVQAQVTEPQVDETYTAEIKKHTTEPFFLTPLVDHLPASDTVPSPMDHFGVIVGAPEVLHYSHEIHGYMRAVAEASPRVEVFSNGTSEEGREMILVVVSDEETIADLEGYKEISARLADPRGLNEEEAHRLMDQAKPMYWATGGLHSGETGSPEMLMEMVYRLAAGESQFIRDIRENAIVMVTPVVEPDGRDKQVDVHMAPRWDPEGIHATRMVYWGKYVLHDNNRDGLGLTLALSRMATSTYLEWHPLVLHDLHESVSYLYTSTGTGPYNAWLDPVLVDEWFQLAMEEVTQLTKYGVPGVWTYGFYDGWAPNYMFYAANGHNGIGRFYETQAARDGSDYIVRASDERQWYRPNPPLEEVVWSIRNNTNLMQSALLTAIHTVAERKQHFLENFYLKGLRSVAKARSEGPAAYVFPSSDPRKGLQASLLQLLQAQGVEIHRAARDLEVGDQQWPEGSYVVRMDQPYSRMADLLLDRQYYNVDDPRPYDDVGWTLGPLFNVETIRVEDTSILGQRMELVEERVQAAGGSERAGRRTEAFAIPYHAEHSVGSFVFAAADLVIEAARASFEAGDLTFPAGSLILKSEGNPEDLSDRLDRAGERYGFQALVLDEVPEVDLHPVGRPRVALMHTWTNTQTEGWIRIALDQMEIPYDYISVHEVRDESRLKDRWDVILFGPARGDALSTVEGIPMTGDPIPWKKTETQPNLGVQDSSDDIRGGLGLEGVLHLRDFLEEGGVFITFTGSSSLPSHFGFTRGMGIRETRDLWARGGVFRAQVSDEKSPLAYGYDDELGVYFNSGPVFGSGFRRFGRFGGVGEGDRPTGRVAGRTPAGG